MKTAWFFGDCFTYGHGCHPGDEYYESYKPQKLFSTILSEKWECKEMNLGKIGAPNQVIIFSILENFHKIKEKDYVVILMTGQHMNNLVPSKKDWYKPFPKNSYTTTDNDELIYELREDAKKNIKQWDNYYKSLYSFIIRDLKNKNVNVIFDSRLDWIWDWKWKPRHRVFETIKQVTNNQIDDGHLSWKGHKQMAHRIAYEYENHLSTLI